MTSIDPTIPRSLERIVMRLLERHPNLRYATSGDVAAELDAFRVRELGGVRRPGSRAREGVRMAAVAAARLPSPSADADLGRTTAAPKRRRRRALALPAGVGAAAAAIALLAAGTIGAILLLGDGGGRGGAVAGQTFEPTATGGAVAVVPDPSPSPSPQPTPVASSGLVPTLAPPPTATFAPTATPAPPVPTPKPAPKPARPAAAGPSRDPAETLGRFYRLIELRDYGGAAALWSPRMRAQYPPGRYIAGRFNATTGITVHRLRIVRMSVSSRASVVSIDITEYRSSGSPRRWVGTWDLVLLNGAWLMDRPHLAAG